MGSFLFRTFVFIALVGFSLSELRAQELEAKVLVVADELGTAKAQVFRNLEQNLTDLLNQHRWTNLKYEKVERIPCQFMLRLKSVAEERNYQAELQVSASRTIFNTDYSSPICLLVDKQVNFTWEEGTPFSFNEELLEDNLMATLAFYAYAIIGLSLDSQVEQGSAIIREPLQRLKSQVLAHQDWSGWQAGNQSIRANLFEALLDDRHNDFRILWCDYHLRGLDICERDLMKGREQIMASLKTLQAYQKDYYDSPYLNLFEACKLSELISLFQQAGRDSKRNLYDLLMELYPHRQDEVGKLNLYE